MEEQGWVLVCIRARARVRLGLRVLVRVRLGLRVLVGLTRMVWPVGLARLVGLTRMVWPVGLARLVEMARPVQLTRLVVQPEWSAVAGLNHPRQLLVREAGHHLMSFGKSDN